MLKRGQIQRVEREVNTLIQNVNNTFKHRSRSQANWREWEVATQAWHNYHNPLFYLWGIEARERMRLGDRAVIEDAILLLEVDPWFFRSGYLKERVLRHLKSAELLEKDRMRLRVVIENVAFGRNRREFRDYCRLALCVWTSEWETHLRQKREIPNVTGQGKVSYLLKFLEAQRDKLNEESNVINRLS
ncbi:MAG TPA: hypothetical protein VGB77_13865 [Abditibacteriaceae bacterium]|jgi:hypothetical protein